jgi:hypothetical protein
MQFANKVVNWKKIVIVQGSYSVTAELYMCLSHGCCPATCLHASFSLSVVCLAERFCGLMVRVSGQRFRCPGSIPGNTIFFEKWWVWRPLSFVSATEELLERKSNGSRLEIREYGRRDSSRWPRDTPLFTKVDTDFADKRRSLGRYISLAD